MIEERILRDLKPAADVAKLLYGPAPVRNYLFRLKGQAVCEAMTDIMVGKRTYRELASLALTHAKRLLSSNVSRFLFGSSIHD